MGRISRGWWRARPRPRGPARTHLQRADADGGRDRAEEASDRGQPPCSGEALLVGSCDDEAAFEQRVASWRRHTIIGVALCVVLPALAFIRTLALEVPHRTLMVVLMAATIVLSPLMLLVPLRTVVAHPRGRLFVDAWTTAGVGLVSLMVYLDGGAASPYVLFYFVLLAHSVLVYPPVRMMIVGGLVVGSYVVVGARVGGVPGVQLVLGGAALLLVAGICALVTHAHVLAFRQTAAYAARLMALAERDGLTGCLNHRAFHQRLQAETARASTVRPLTVLLIDVDRFKEVNDTRGHAAGDRVLQLVGDVLTDVSRGTDAVARLGGDEFALLMPSCGTVEAMLVGDRLRGQISQRGVAYDLTVSVGAATALAPCEPERLLADADRALYAAKGSGRNITLHAGITAAVGAATLAKAAAAARARRRPAADHA